MSSVAAIINPIYTGPLSLANRLSRPPRNKVGHSMTRESAHPARASAARQSITGPLPWIPNLESRREPPGREWTTPWLYCIRGCFACVARQFQTKLDRIASGGLHHIHLLIKSFRTASGVYFCWSDPDRSGSRISNSLDLWIFGSLDPESSPDLGLDIPVSAEKVAPRSHKSGSSPNKMSEDVIPGASTAAGVESSLREIGLCIANRHTSKLLQLTALKPEDAVSAAEALHESASWIFKELKYSGGQRVKCLRA